MTTTQGTIDKFWFKCNKGTKVRVFDTYDWEFKPEFNPDNKGSKVPPPIVDLVGGSDTGGATLKQPAAGWDNPALGSIFSTRNQLPLPDSSSPPSATSLPTGRISDETQKSNKGPIIGGVVGGVCIIALVAGVLIFFRRKGQKSSQAQPGKELQGGDLRVELQGNYGPHELHAYELPEMSAVAGDLVEIGGEEQKILVGHNSPLPR